MAHSTAGAVHSGRRARRGPELIIVRDWPGHRQGVGVMSFIAVCQWPSQSCGSPGNDSRRRRMSSRNTRSPGSVVDVVDDPGDHAGGVLNVAFGVRERLTGVDPVDHSEQLAGQLEGSAANDVPANHRHPPGPCLAGWVGVTALRPAVDSVVGDEVL